MSQPRTSRSLPKLVRFKMICADFRLFCDCFATFLWLIWAVLLMNRCQKGREDAFGHA